MPTTLPIAKAIATNASQPQMAFLRLRALQRPMRAANVLSCMAERVARGARAHHAGAWPLAGGGSPRALGGWPYGGRQYHLPRANPPKAMSPMRRMISPIQKLQTIISTIPTMTRIPPSPMPPMLRLLTSLAQEPYPDVRVAVTRSRQRRRTLRDDVPRPAGRPRAHAGPRGASRARGARAPGRPDHEPARMGSRAHRGLRGPLGLPSRRGRAAAAPRPRGAL